MSMLDLNILLYFNAKVGLIKVALAESNRQLYFISFLAQTWLGAIAAFVGTRYAGRTVE